jgi:non-ribosomal peptide synthetase component E (peptide arylation enzyme)
MIDEYLQRGYWKDELTSDLCDQNALKYPDREALVDERKRLTWAQVKIFSDRLALGLVELGFKKDDILLVQMYNCVEQFLMRNACEKAGVIYAFAPITFREGELKPIMQHLNPKGVAIPRVWHRSDLFQMMQNIQNHVESFRYILMVGEEVPKNTLSLEEMMEKPAEAKYPQDYLQKTKFSAFETSQIYSTSGTTGTPKCLEWTASGRLATGRDYVKRLKLDHEKVIVCLGPFSAGGNTTLCYRAVPVAGSKLVFLKEFSPEAACQLLEKEKAYGASLVPTLLIRLLNYLHLDKYDLTSLKFMLTATAPLPLPVALEAEERLNIVMVNAYGSGESGSVTVTSLDDPQDKRISVLRPLDGAKIRITDDEGNDLPAGKEGNVFVGGAHLAGGYYKNPGMTHEIWRDGWVDMKELGRLDSEGNIMLVGRKRDTIIRGGQNIYPKEIEDLLMQHPKVAEAVVVPMPDYEMGQRACAYVLPKSGEQFTFEEMADYLKSKKLAMFKLPERLELVEEFPLAAGGQKIDKRMLEEDIAHKLEQEGKIREE